MGTAHCIFFYDEIREIGTTAPKPAEYHTLFDRFGYLWEGS